MFGDGMFAASMHPSSPTFGGGFFHWVVAFRW